MLFGLYILSSNLTHSIQIWKANSRYLVRAWILAPAGVVLMLLFIMGVNLLIAKTGISFPASVFTRAICAYH
jgi:hypothetical protein